MPTIQRFEEIESWKIARKLTADIYAVCRKRPIASDLGLCDQIRRASVSVMANIAEGFGRGGNKEFVQFLSYARGSSSELRSLLYVMIDSGFIDQPTFDDLYERSNHAEALITKLMNYLQTSEICGTKFRK